MNFRIRKTANRHTHAHHTISVLFLYDSLVIWKIWWDEGSLFPAGVKALDALGGLQASINLRLVPSSS